MRGSACEFSRLAASGLRHAESCSGPALKLQVELYFFSPWVHQQEVQSFLKKCFETWQIFEIQAIRRYVSMQPHIAWLHLKPGNLSTKPRIQRFPYIAWILGLGGRSPAFKGNQALSGVRRKVVAPGRLDFQYIELFFTHGKCSYIERKEAFSWCTTPRKDNEFGCAVQL